MNDPLVTGVIPAPVTSATEAWFLGACWIVNRQRITVKEAGLTGIAFFGDDHRDTDQLRFVGEQLDETGVWVAVE